MHLRVLGRPDEVPPELIVSAQAVRATRYQRSTRTDGAEGVLLTGLGAGRFRLTAWDRFTGLSVWSRFLDADGSNDVSLTIDLR